MALWVWLSQGVTRTSLMQLCSRLEASTGVLMSPEGLNQRFNPAAVTFLREVFTSLLTFPHPLPNIFLSKTQIN